MTNIYTLKKGEKFPINITIRNSELDEPIDLTNAKINFQLKDELKDDFFIINKEITTESDLETVGQIINPANGEFVVRFTDEDFEKLVVERVYYLTIWYIITDENFSKVISSNGSDNLKFMVCYP